MNKTDQVSIIIGTHNQPILFKKCLDYLFSFTSSGYQIILVLNEVSEQTKKIANNFSSRNKNTIIIKNEKNNKSFARWNNEAVLMADRKYVLYLNDDTSVSFRWLESMVDLFENTPLCGAVGKVLIEEERTVKIATGTCLLVERINARFDPSFTGYYFEDTDLIKRLEKKGLKIVVETNFPIRHTGRATSDTRKDIINITNLNEQIFKKKYKPLTKGL